MRSSSPLGRVETAVGRLLYWACTLAVGPAPGCAVGCWSEAELPPVLAALDAPPDGAVGDDDSADDDSGLTDDDSATPSDDDDSSPAPNDDDDSGIPADDDDASPAQDDDDSATPSDDDDDATTPPAPVDQDGDGFPSVASGGDDCNDGDPAVHPGQTAFFYQPAASSPVPSTIDPFDYDCDGVITYERPLLSTGIVNCPDECGGSTAVGAAGWAENVGGVWGPPVNGLPDCGETAYYVELYWTETAACDPAPAPACPNGQGIGGNIQQGCR